MEVVKTKIQRYNEYKDSGVEWLGQIPKHWKIERGKWLFLKKERPVRKEDKIITCFRDGEVTLRSNRKKSGFTIALQEHGYQGLRKGDLVIHAMDAFAGAIGVSDSNGKSTPVYSVCVERFPGTINQYYYSYFLRSLALNGIILALAKGIRERSTDFRFSDFGELSLSFPPLSEQTKIAQFLDDKTTKIDAAITLKEQQINLLKERKQILIHKAVTRGLDENVPLKDSGVEWIGEIPEGWEVRRLASFGRFSKGGGFSKSDLVDTGVSAILYGDIYTKYDISIKKEVRFISIETAKKSIKIDKQDLLFTGSGETIEDIGKCVVFLNDKIAYAGGDVIIFKQTENDSLFLSFTLNTEGAKFEKARFSKGEIIVHTYGSKLRNIYIPIPPILEQKEISEYIEDGCQKIETAISLKQEEIAKLKEYKRSLINDVVTGKVKVS